MSIATINPRLKVPACAHSRVFRRIDETIRRNATAARAFKTILSWTGSDDDAVDPAPDLCPFLRMSPGEGGDEWYGPASFESILSIDCELAVLGSNAEDGMDLLQVVRRALYPADAAAGLAIQAALKAGGASQTGQPRFSPPGLRVASTAAGMMMLASFTITIDVLLDINA